MNKYESVIIINPTVDEEGMKALISKFTDLIRKNLQNNRWNYKIHDSKKRLIIVKKAFINK